MQLLLDYPWYFVLLCLLAGAIYSFALYRKGSDHKTETPKHVTVLLAALRFLTVSAIAFLLLAPLVKHRISSHEKPIIVLEQDVSESVRSVDYSKFEIQNSEFEIVRDSFGGKTTDIAEALRGVADRYRGRNLGAVVLISDGIYNQGQNPATIAPSLATPIYTVALGDTTHHPAAAIANLRYNHTAYMGNQFPLEVTLHAHRLKGSHGTLSVTHNGKRLFSKEIPYNDNHFSTTEAVTLEADHPGLQSYTVTLETPSIGRKSTHTIAVEVIDGHQKIAILTAAPHPDVGALRRAIERNENYEVEVLDKGDLGSKKLSDYSLLILHNLPARGMKTDIRQIPAIFILGSQTDLGQFNAMHLGLEIVAKARKSDEATAVHNGAFSLFNIDEEVCRKLEQMPPLSTPFGTYRPAANLQALFTSKIGSVASDRPLVAFCQQEGIRHAFVAGEGLWRWRLQDYLANGSHDAFDQLIEKMVVYTSLQTQKERFHVTTQHIYRDNEPVVIEAELYDDNYEPVNTPDATLELRSKMENTERDSRPNSQFTFNRSAGGYTLPLGTLAPGHYTYTATTTLSGRKYTATGSFIVEDINLEQSNLVADHALLNTIAQTTGAQMLLPDEFDRLPQFLSERDDLKSIVYSHTRYTELLNLPLIFIFLVLLLAAEWVIRKWGNGDL